MSTEETTICPLCQQDNQCQLNEKHPCWCTKEVVSKALIDKVAKEKQGKVCICLACIRKFNFDLATRKL
ncbi:cysteine-rich CWC family protein [Thalassotalea ganghwensis]